LFSTAVLVSSATSSTEAGTICPQEEVKIETIQVCQLSYNDRKGKSTSAASSAGTAFSVAAFSWALEGLANKGRLTPRLGAVELS
jgi:hypothetical protein